MKYFMGPLLVLTACGGGDGAKRIDAATSPDDSMTIDGQVIDAAVHDAPVDSPSGTMHDARPDAQAFVLTVTCDGSEVGTITTSGNAYSPNTFMINQNEIVKFVMPFNHNVVPDPTATLTDPGLDVPFNATTCLQFTATGTFGFKCSVHGFKGSVTVQ